MSEERKKLTTDAGRPVGDNQNSLTVGPRGPIVFEDYQLFEKMAQFNRERIPERVVHAKGSGAYGYFVCTNPAISKYTTAKLFSASGKRTPTFLRFSTVGGEKGSADTERDPRGFALKFYTEEGNWDMVGNNTPIFFIRDPLKFGDFIHTQKRDPETNLKSPTMMWDFWTLSPESLHQVTILFSDRGTPDGYRHMDGFSSHTFSLINSKSELFYVKWHFKTKQGIKNFTRESADEMRGKDPDYAQRDLFNSIAKGDFPKWRVAIQIMPEKEAEKYRINPFDLPPFDRSGVDARIVHQKLSRPLSQPIVVSRNHGDLPELEQRLEELLKPSQLRDPSAMSDVAGDHHLVHFCLEKHPAEGCGHAFVLCGGPDVQIREMRKLAVLHFSIVSSSCRRQVHSGERSVTFECHACIKRRGISDR